MPSRALRTVIVDDVEGLRRLVKMVLDASDAYDVVAEAEDGTQALAAVEETSPDLVLLDLSMPGMDGFDVLDQIRKTDPEVGVVVLSGHDEEHMQKKARDNGALGYLEKGLTPENLVRSLDELVAERLER